MCITVSSGSCDGRGYRSTGVYDNGWFDGACGTGHPFYLLCQSCRECYLRENQSARSTHSDAQDSLATPTVSGGQGGSLSERLTTGPLAGGLGAPDLLGAAEMKPDSKHKHHCICLLSLHTQKSRCINYNDWCLFIKPSLGHSKTFNSGYLGRDCFIEIFKTVYSDMFHRLF